MSAIGGNIQAEFEQIINLLVEEELGLMDKEAMKHGDSFTVLRIRSDFEPWFVSFVQQVYYLLSHVKDNGEGGGGDGNNDNDDDFRSTRGLRAVQHLQSLEEAVYYFEGHEGDGLIDSQLATFILEPAKKVLKKRQEKHKEMEARLNAYGGAGERTPVAKKRRPQPQEGGAALPRARKKRTGGRGTSATSDDDVEYRPPPRHQQPQGGKGGAMVKVMTMKSRVEQAQHRVFEKLRAIGEDVCAIDDELRRFFRDGSFRESGGVMDKFSFEDREKMKTVIKAIQVMSSADTAFTALGTDSERTKELCALWIKDKREAQSQPGFLAIGKCLLEFYVAQTKKKKQEEGQAQQRKGL